MNGKQWLGWVGLAGGFLLVLIGARSLEAWLAAMEYAKPGASEQWRVALFEVSLGVLMTLASVWVLARRRYPRFFAGVGVFAGAVLVFWAYLFWTGGTRG